MTCEMVRLGLSLFIKSGAPLDFSFSQESPKRRLGGGLISGEYSRTVVIKACSGIRQADSGI